MAVVLKWFGKECEKQILSATEQAVMKGCFMIEKDVKTSMQPGTGREYKRGGKIHRASVTGQPPAVDSGRLRASIASNWSGSGLANGNVTNPKQSGDGVSMPPTEPNKFTGRVGTNVFYGKILEYGSVKMGPRPFLRPAFEKNISKIRNLFENLIKK